MRTCQSVRSAGENWDMQLVSEWGGSLWDWMWTPGGWCQNWSNCRMPSSFGIKPTHLVTEVIKVEESKFSFTASNAFFCSSIPVCPWATYLVSFSFSFSICIMGTIISLWIGIRRIWENTHKIFRAVNGSSSDQWSLFMVKEKTGWECF